MPHPAHETNAPTTLPNPEIEETGVAEELLETAFILPSDEQLDTDDLIDAAEELLRQGAPHDFDVAVIGAGPGGLACASQLAQSNLKVVVIEDREIGGGLPQSRLHSDQNIARIGRRAASGCAAPRRSAWE